MLNTSQIFNETKEAMARCGLAINSVEFSDLSIHIVEGRDHSELGSCIGTLIRVSDTVGGVARPVAHIVATLAHEICHALDAGVQDGEAVAYADRIEELRANKIENKIARRYRRGLIH